MTMMKDVLSNYLDDFVVVFLDDILLYTRIVEIHAEHLGKVLKALRQYCLYAKAWKCNIMEEEFEFLGQWITPQGAAPLNKKWRPSWSGNLPKTWRGPDHSWGLPTTIAALFKDMRSWHPHWPTLQRKMFDGYGDPLNDRLSRSWNKLYVMCRFCNIQTHPNHRWW